MSDPLKAAARAGDPKALEVLMNKFFGSKGITVRVTNSGSLLRVLLRGKTAPDKGVLTVIRQGLGSIKPAGFNKVIVTAKAMGKRDSWSEQWELAGGSVGDSLPAPAPPKPAVKTLASNQPPTAWYKKSWLIITLLVFFPFVGIPLVWTSQWSKNKKIGTSIVSGIWLLALFIQDPNPTPTIRAQESQQELSVEEPAAAEVAQVEASPPPVVDRTFADAVNQAMAASEASQTATSQDDWDSVANLWDAAVSQMESVPALNADYATAQLKVNEYQQNLDYAKERSIALSPKLNLSKAELKSYFSQRGLGFSFEEIPLTDGTPRLLGNSANGLMTIELYGSTDAITEAVILTIIGEGVPTNLLASVNLAFLNKVAPGYDWESTLSETMLELFDSKSEEKQRIRAGNKIVSIKLSEISGNYMLLVNVTPE